MKKLALLLALCLALSPACLAEASSAEAFLNSLSQTWDAFLVMMEDAGQGASELAEDSGVADWARDTANDVAKWAADSGLTEWAQGALRDLSTWFDESGIPEQAAEASREFREFMDENRPAVEAWLAEAGEEVARAWNTLLNADEHTEAEVREARETVTESLEEAGM